MIRRITDLWREWRIDQLRQALARSRGDEVVITFAKLAAEINSRSPEQVERMERERWV